MKCLSSEDGGGIPAAAALLFFSSLMWFHVYFALQKIPPPLCHYSHRAVRLTVIYIANRILNWGQVEAYLPPHNSDLSVWGFKTAERQSETAGSGSARLGHINLAEDKESEEVVTARSWIYPSAPSQTVSPNLFFFPLSCVVAGTLARDHHVSGDGSGDKRRPRPSSLRCSGRAASFKRRPLPLSIINIKKKK